MQVNPGQSPAKPVTGIDLHIHTVASPCAELEMLPSLIIKRAVELGVGCLAITDHNTTANIPAVMHCAAQHGVRVLPGMEVQTREEVHLLCLFDTLEQAAAWQTVVDGALPDIPNRPDVFGAQLIVDENDDFIRFIDRMLLIATSLTVEQVINQVNSLHGIVIAAHVDRQAYSLLAVLGFIPPELNLAALEISRAVELGSARSRFPSLRSWPLITNSDAHRLVEMRCSMRLELETDSLCVQDLASFWQSRYL